MIFSNYYWYFKSALSHKLCDEIIKHALSKKDNMGLTGGYNKKNLKKQDIEDLKETRDSNIIWLNDKWIYKELHPFINTANEKAGWNFQWDNSESIQFTKYKVNQYYDWHIDSDSPNENNKIRKLSMTCQLTDSSEYKGGELEFDFRNYAPNMRDEFKHRVQCKEILSKGSIIVFPSFVWHRVKPVREGTRYSLVMWNTGDKFK